MADNVIKFRKIEKKPEEPKKTPGGGPPNWPSWLPFAVLVAIAVAIVLAQQSGLIGG
ncbi:hypothetical protein [Devosia sp.]|uniref:hypothetical protein n=1 Tax=Devosia sp. TaxID=1871048 RepID=UPI003A9467CA